MPAGACQGAGDPLIKIMSKLLLSGFFVVCIWSVTAYAQMNYTNAAGLPAVWQPDVLNYKVQWPYDQSRASRYTFTEGVHHLWVFNQDQPFARGNRTLPRSELRFNPDYTNGVHQFEADLMVPANVDNVTIMQIHTSNADEPEFGPVAFMFQVHHGAMHQGNNPRVLLPDIYGKWFHLNVIHDLNGHRISVYVNHALVGQYRDSHANGYYFKCGVYMCRQGSPEMQVYIKNIRLWHQG